MTNQLSTCQFQAFFENDKSHLRNSYVKFVMCMLQGDYNIKDLVISLPQDIQALVLLHNPNANHNITSECSILFGHLTSIVELSVSILVSSTDLLQFSDLQILEIRSTGSNRNLLFSIDESMPTLKHVNFESIKLMADEKIKKRIKYQHPSETYDYVPEGGRYAYKNEGEDSEDEIEIVPYDVYKMELSKSIRPNFFGWNDLEVMRIHNCHLDDMEWEMFAGLEHLQHLSLEHNDIKVIPSFAFYGALHLKTLSLAHNDILDMHYLALAGLLDLEHLDLSSNNLTKLSEATFPPFPSMKTLDLRENPIEFILPMTFAILNTTKELILGSTSTALDLANTNEAFVSLDQLKILNILNIKSTSLHQTLFTGLKNVERLRLKGVIERIEYDAFAEMPRIKELILSGCGISDISMDAFFGIKDLRVIDLSHNQLDSVPFGLFDEQKQLHEIYLQNNYLKKMPENFFSPASLKLVRLTANPWDCSCEMSDWNQAITNSVRLNKLTSNKDDNCIRNPKTGKIDHCNDKFDDFPKYSYGFDNKLSPLCSGSSPSEKSKSVYFVLRHSIKCSQPAGQSATGTVEKQRIQNKLMDTMEKFARSQGHSKNDETKEPTSWASQQSSNRKIRKIQHENKVKRTLSQNAKVLHEQVRSNDIAYEL